MAGLGEASGIIGILASAVQAARNLRDFVIEVRDATADATAIGEDAQALSSILVTLQKWLLSGTIKPAAATSLTGALNTCLLTTNQLKEVIEPYTKPIRSRSRWTWRSLKWTLNKQEVRELRERWLQSKLTLGISLSIINTYAVQTGIEKVGEQIEAGNDALLHDFRNLRQNILRQKENKMDAISILGRQGSLSNRTDANFPLRRYMEELPPEDHPWARMSEPQDVLSLESLSIYDLGTRASTPDVDADAATVAPVRDTTLTQDSRDLPDPDSDLRLVNVMSAPALHSKMHNLDAVSHTSTTEEGTNPQRSVSLPWHGLSKDPNDVEYGRDLSSSTKADVQVHGPLHQALIDENTYSFMSLLTTNIDVNQLGLENRTPLHVCALLNDKITAHALLRTGRVDFAHRDVHGRTALRCALEVGNDSLACLTIQYGANIQDLADFMIEMTRRMHKPAEERTAHACLAWLAAKDDWDMQNCLINTLAAKSGSSTGSVARLLEGTPFREPYIQQSSTHVRSRSMDNRQKAIHAEPRATVGRLGVEEYFGTNVAAARTETSTWSDRLSPNPTVQNSVSWRLSNHGKIYPR